MSKPLFEKYIASILKQIPVFIELDRRSNDGLLDSDAHGLIEEYLGKNYPLRPGQAWKIVKDWLLTFFPSEYRLEPAQEVLIKGKSL